MGYHHNLQLFAALMLSMPLVILVIVNYFFEGCKMIRAILLIGLIALAHTMAYEDEMMQERAAMHNGLGCFTDTECETGEEDPEISEQLNEEV